MMDWYLWNSLKKMAGKHQHLTSIRLLTKGKHMATVTVGHGSQISIQYLDQNGNPMLVTPTPDAPPQWSDAQNPVGDAVLTVAADSLTAVLDAKAPGSDVVTVNLTVASKPFTASLPVTIQAVPQVLTSIALQIAIG